MHELQNDSVCLPSDVDDDDESCRSCHRSLGHTHTHTNTPSNTQLSCISHGRPVPAPPRCAHLLNSSFQVSFSDMLFVCCCPWLPSPKPSPCPFSSVCVCQSPFSFIFSPFFLWFYFIIVHTWDVPSSFGFSPLAWPFICPPVARQAY